MAWYRAGGGGGGVPASLKNDMNAVFNKKFGTSTDYPPTGWPDDVNIMGPLPKGKSSGAIAHITDGADDVPTSSCEVEIAPTLTGVSSVGVARQGKNLFDKSSVETDKYLDTSTGLPVPAVNYVVSDYIPVFSGVTIFIPTSWTARRWFYDKNKTPTTYLNNSLDQAYTPSADGYIRVSILKTQVDLDTYQIEYGSTASAYEAYETPTTYTASLGRTVYGGSADIVNGTGTEAYGYFTADGSEDWQAGTNYYYISGAEAPQNPSVADDTGVSNYGALVSSASMDGIFIINNLLQICGSAASAFSDVNDLKAKLAITPLEVSYKLATPTDFTFDGVEVPTRLAVNNFFSDVGDTSVEYRKDINLAIGLNKYRYLRWKISATRTTSSYCQMSDIEFSDANGNTFTFPTGTTVTASTSATSGSSPAYIVDGNTATKFCGNWVAGGITLNIDLGMGNVIDVSVFKNFSWYTANDATDRDPKTWELYGIDNANNEILLCSRDYTPTTDRKALADTVTITPLE